MTLIDNFNTNYMNISALKVICFSEAKTEEEKTVLKVLNVSFNVHENAIKHNTSQYEITEVRTDEDGTEPTPQLVVRRGESFDISIDFDRAFNKDKDDIKLVFETSECDISVLERHF